MSTENVERLLRSVGMMVFVEYFDDFRNLRISNEAMIDKLPEYYTLASRRTRTSKARKIFELKQEAEALRLVANAQMVKPVVADQARELLKRYRVS